jgi:hypothetical protein
MKYFVIFLVVALMAMVVVSLVRGIVTFLASAREDANRAPGDGPSPLQLRQNQLMFSRVKYQALAVLVIVVLLAVSH